MLPVINDQSARPVSTLPGPAVARDILVDVAHKHGVNPHAVIGPRRIKKLIEPRRDLWRQLHARGWSLAQIGRYSNRDHTTVRHGLGLASPKRTYPARTLDARELRGMHDTVVLYMMARDGVAIDATIAGWIVAPDEMDRHTRYNRGHHAMRRLKASLGTDFEKIVWAPVYGGAA